MNERSQSAMLLHFPPQTTPFVGRTQESADITTRLANPDCRLLTITGGGGSGKTRLAITIAQSLGALFPDGAVFVDLQPARTNDLIVAIIAHALDFAPYGSDDPQPQLEHYLRDKSLLLVLDNFEHLLDSAPLVSRLLANAPGIKVLVTSREALNLQEEWLYPLKGMITPHSIYSTELENYEAIQLFLYHARRMQPNFNFAEQSEAVIRICNVAEGLPLAIWVADKPLSHAAAISIARGSPAVMAQIRITASRSRARSKFGCIRRAW